MHHDVVMYSGRYISIFVVINIQLVTGYNKSLEHELS